MKPNIRRALKAGEKIRVLVVDDSVVMRRLVSLALAQDAAIDVVGVASNGVVALQRIPLLNPDVITLDVEMPEMDGLEMLGCIRQRYPHLRVIMCSTLTERGAAITLDALRLGADDYLTKTSNGGALDRSLDTLREQLLPRIKQFFVTSQAAREVPLRALWSPTPDLGRRPAVVAIGVSTGGPAALAEVLPALPAEFPVPILVVQHMPPLFTRFLAERLNAICQLHVTEAANSEAVEPGKILIAPGDFHMKVRGSSPDAVRIELDQTAPQNSCRPAVDALLTSLADVYCGSAVLAVILTGMGQDGLRGAKILKSQGGSVLAQDEATSVVWGMPGSIVREGLANRVLPLAQIAPELVRMADRRKGQPC